MKNKTLIYLGGAALAYYLYKKSNKSVITPSNISKITLSNVEILAMTDINLASLIADLSMFPNKYFDPASYAIMATTEQKRRLSNTSSSTASNLPTSNIGTIFLK
jgi:hypothetical protein